MIDSLEGASRDELEAMLYGVESIIDDYADRIAELETEQDIHWRHKWDIERALTRLGT